MTGFNDIKACAFDAYGTLFDVHAPVTTLANELGLDARAISDMWRANQLQYTWLRSLMNAHADFWKVTADALDYALGAHGIERPELRAQLMQLYLELEAYPDAADALQRLRDTGIETAILSNGSPTMLDAAIAHAGLAELLNEVISIEDAGVYKPAASVYRLAPERLGIEAGQIAFVSANAWDASGAAHFGLQVIHLNRFDQPAECLPGEPRAVIKSLDELKQLLD